MDYLKSKIIKRTLQESIEYYKDLGLTKEEYIPCIEDEFHTKAENIKYIFTIEGENVEGHAEGVQFVDGTFTVQTETAERNGYWLSPRIMSYDEMIEVLVNNCKVY